MSVSLTDKSQRTTDDCSACGFRLTVNTFAKLMAAQNTTGLPPSVQESNDKSKLHNYVIRWLEEEGLSFQLPAITTKVQRFVKLLNTVVDTMWFIATYHQCLAQLRGVIPHQKAYAGSLIIMIPSRQLLQCFARSPICPHPSVTLRLEHLKMKIGSKQIQPGAIYMKHCRSCLTHWLGMCIT